MNTTDIIELVKEKKLTPDHIKNYLKKNDLSLFNTINNIQCLSSKFYYKFFCFHYNIQSNRCKHCGKIIESYPNKTFNYLINDSEPLQYCKSCYYQFSNFKNNLLEKRKRSWLEKYGSEHPSKNQIIQDKIKETCIKKYGENYQKEFTKRMMNSMEKKYGVSTNLKLKENIKKSKQTCLEKYGVDNYTKTKEFKDIYTEKKYEKVLNDPLVTPLFTKEELESTSILKWKCKKCGNIFESKYDYNWKHRARCLKCFPLLNGESESEKEIKQFLIDSKITNIQTKVRHLIPPLEIDIYLPNYNLAIEYDGLYWHSEECGISKDYHLNKTIQCQSKGIDLIHIFEDEWLLKKEIVKSKLLSILKPINTQSENYTIKSLDESECKSIVNEIGLFEYQNRDISYGLYSNDQLVSTMSFFKISDSTYEIRNVGGIINDILINHFIKQFNPSKLISYCDRRWLDRKEFLKFNFTIAGYTDPSYWYTDCHTNQRNYRTKSNSTDNDLTKIWDCGQVIVELRLS